MARRRSIWFIAVAVGAFVGALGVLSASAAPPAEADATAVTQWNLIAVSTITGFPGRGFQARRAEHRRHLRSTWEWCRGPCTTRSTRSRRSITGRTF